MNGTADRLARALGDRYAIERELGAGGMATVYLAHDLKHDRKVALKVLKPELAAVVGSERFLAEIRTTANLQHPHILPLFDSGEADGLVFYVMPYIAGESLRHKLDREKQLGMDDAVLITIQVASAIDHAHSQNVVHRDIKPENILLQEGQALIADFGIALALRQAAGNRLTGTGLSLGTPQYMSPEQATGDRDVDARSDVYSLACVLYEMLAGQPPHNGPTVQAVIAKVLSERPRLVNELRGTVPMHVAVALDIALEKLPADRFASANEFAEALTRASATPRRGRAVTEPPNVSPWNGLTIGLLAACALLTVSLALSRFGERREPGTGLVEYLPLALRYPPKAPYMTGSGVEMSPDGNRVAYRDGDGSWWLLDLVDGGARAVPLGIGGLHIDFSPTGDSLARTTSSWLQQLVVVDLATGRAKQVTDSAQGEPRWEPDGWIYYRDQLNGLRRVHVADGDVETVVRPGLGEHWQAVNPALLPGGKGILYTRVPLAPRNPAGSEIMVLDLDTRESRVLEAGVEAEVTTSGHLIVLKTDGSLLAAPFDVRSMEIRGQLVTVLQGLEVRELWEIGGSFTVGADGSFLYVQAQPIPDDTVVFVGRNGQVRRRTPTWRGTVTSVAYDDATGRWAAVVHPGLKSPNVFAMSEAGGEPRRLTFGEVVDNSPRFIPNGGDVAFVSPREGKNWDLYRVPFDGSGPLQLMLDRPGDILGPRFTDDARWIVFCEQNHLGERDVMAHRLGPDSGAVAFAATSAQECDPDVSPDGKWLTYTSDETGESQVWVRPFDPDATARWQVSREGATDPHWSTSGRELFYINAKQDLVAVSLASGSSFDFGSPRALFPLGEELVWTGETAAEDQEFILIRKEREAASQVVLIRNFFELLRQKAGE